MLQQQAIILNKILSEKNYLTIEEINESDSESESKSKKIKHNANKMKNENKKDENGLKEENKVNTEIKNENTHGYEVLDSDNVNKSNSEDQHNGGFYAHADIYDKKKDLYDKFEEDLHGLKTRDDDGYYSCSDDDVEDSQLPPTKSYFDDYTNFPSPSSFAQYEQFYT
jgi:hypothetical protein